MLAAINKRDRNHRKAKKELIMIFEKSNEIPMVSDYILDECYTYVAYNIPEKLDKFEKFVEMFLIVPVGIETFRRAKEVFKKFFPKLSFTDSTTIVLAKGLNARLLSYDEEMTRVFYSY